MAETLLALILALTGIARDVDPELTAVAQRRAVEVQANYSHAGVPRGTVEVLHFSEWAPEHADWASRNAPAQAVEQWRLSPGHWAVLADRSLTRIGCAVSQAGPTYYFVCLLAAPRGTDLMLPDTATGP